MSPLLAVWKFFKKHRREQKQTFRQVSEIFENPRKSSEKIGKCRKVHKTTFQHFSNLFKIFGNHRKSSNVLKNLRENLEIVPKCFKTTFQHFYFFLNLRKLLEVFGNLGILREKSEKCRKVLKMTFRQFLQIFENFRKFSEVFGNAWKTSETLGKFPNVIGGLRKFFRTFQFHL